MCNCRSPDYFYGVGGFYQGSSLALGLHHHTYCVPAEQQTLHKPKDGKGPVAMNNKNIGKDDALDSAPGSLGAASWSSKCSWRALHAVESVTVDVSRFSSIMRAAERQLIASGLVTLSRPIVNMNPHANG